MTTYDYDEATGCISILARSETDCHREALTPGRFDRAREILPDDLYEEVQTLWTPEVLEAWESMKANANI